MRIRSKLLLEVKAAGIFPECLFVSGKSTNFRYFNSIDSHSTERGMAPLAHTLAMHIVFAFRAILETRRSNILLQMIITLSFMYPSGILCCSEYPYMYPELIMKLPHYQYIWRDLFLTLTEKKYTTVAQVPQIFLQTVFI